MNTYLGLLRGVNVGGNSLIKMSDLKDALLAAGLLDVRTYIQSGNVIFSSKIKDTDKLALLIKKVIQKQFSITTDVAVFSKDEWKHIIDAAPKWWGFDKGWRHNLLIMIGQHDMKDVARAVGELKPDIEAIKPGKGVLYQSMSIELFGRTTTGKIASNPIYKKMTIRNYNTATKLLAVLANE